MAWKKEQINYMNLKIRILEEDFGKYYEEWNSKFRNDKQLFCNLYEILIEGCEKMKNVNCNYINVAFSARVDEDIEILKDIISRFEKMELKV